MASYPSSDAGNDASGSLHDAGGPHDLRNAKDLAAVFLDLTTGDMTVVCDPKPTQMSLSPSDGHHNPGQNCGNCHGGQFTIAGTLYTKKTGGTGMANATIDIVDATGYSLQIVTAGNGNFWAFDELVFPLRARGSLCPSIGSMMDTVDTGSCNSCHDSTMRIYLP